MFPARADGDVAPKTIVYGTAGADVDRHSTRRVM